MDAEEAILAVVLTLVDLDRLYFDRKSRKAPKFIKPYCMMQSSTSKLTKNNTPKPKRQLVSTKLN